MPVAINGDIPSTLTGLEELLRIPEQLWTQEDRIKWERAMERAIKNQETRCWRENVTSSRLAKFLKLPGAPSILNGMSKFPKDIWDTTLQRTKGFNRLLRLFDHCWPGTDRFFRSIDQFMQFALMLRGELHCLTILPTGSGKTLPVVLYAKWLETNRDQLQGHIIMVIPYVMLYGQVRQVMQGASISYSKWELESRLGPNGAPTVIAVSLEHSVRPEFWADMSPLLVEKRIKGLVIDEAQAAVDDQSFRSSFKSLGPRLSTLPAPVWLLTATCPPKYEDRLWSSLGIYNMQNTTITLHQTQQKENIYFQLVAVVPHKCSTFAETCASTIKCELISAMNPTPNGKVLVLTHRKKDVEEAAQVLGVDYIHGGVSQDQRERILDRFQNMGSGHLALVANKACYYGMDIGCISFVVFIGLPDSLLSLQQAVGRAGRRGQRVDCIIMLPPIEPSRKRPRVADFAGESLVPLLLSCPCVDGLLQAFFNEEWIPCRGDNRDSIACNGKGFWPYDIPFTPQLWEKDPPPIRITPHSPHWITSNQPIPPSPLSSLAPALIKERKAELLRSHHIHLWKQSLFQIVDSAKRSSKLRKCLYCLCNNKKPENTNHTWFKCFPSDSKLKNYEFWGKIVEAGRRALGDGRVVYKAKDPWKRYYLPIFSMSSEEDSQLSSHKRKDNFRPALSPVCGKCHGPVWEEAFHHSVDDSYGPCQHEDLILEVIFVLWAETKIRGEFLVYLGITDSTFTNHPDHPTGGRFAEWLWSESEVRGWCNAALWAVPWFAYVYRSGELGRERYGVTTD